MQQKPSYKHDCLKKKLSPSCQQFLNDYVASFVSSVEDKCHRLSTISGTIAQRIFKNDHTSIVTRRQTYPHQNKWYATFLMRLKCAAYS